MIVINKILFEAFQSAGIYPQPADVYPSSF